MEKRILSIILSIAVLIGIVPVMSLTVFAATTTGTTGDCTWSFDDTTGTLTVSGNGAMADYTNGSQPWYAYKDSIKTVIVEKGVTAVSEYAFYQFPALETVKIAGSVTAIGSNAFYSCTNLSTVEYYGSSNPVSDDTAFFGCYCVVKVPSSYSGNVFCGKMVKATLDAANEPVTSTPAAPTVTGVSFNESSPAYDSETNTFKVSDTNPFILTITGERLSELTGNKLRALFFGDAQGSGGVIIDVMVESDTRAYVSVNTSRLTYILNNAVGSGSSSTKATSVMVQNDGVTVGTVNVNLVHAPATPTPIGVSLEVTKSFNDWSKAESFTFILEPVTAGAPMPASTTAIATKHAPFTSFGNIIFESEGTYEYTITEVDDGIDGITYDKTEHEVVVTVTRGDDNSLTASVRYDDEESLVITNTYMKPAYIAAVDVADGTEIQGATIQLLDEQGDVVDEWVSTVEAHEVFGLIAGEIYTVHNTVAPIGYTIATDTQFRLDQYGNVISTGSVDQYGVILVEFAMTEVSIAVVDIADSAKLEGATVQIFDLNGDLVEEWVSTTEAYEVIGLETNKVHTVRTAVTPNGYDIPTDVQFALDENGNITCTGSVSADGMILVELAKTLTNVASVTVGGNTTNYADLEEAFEAAAGASGSTLTLLDNISRDEAITVTSSNFTVDLNGKTWECTNGRVIDLQSDAKLRIVDGSTNKNGKLLASNNGTPAISMRNNAELEIAGGTVESMTGCAVDMSLSGNATSAKLVISGGKLITNGNVTIFAFGSSITITGGTFEHNDSNSAAHIYFRTGAVDLSGHPDPSGINIAAVHINGDITLGEDTLNLPNGYVMLDYYSQAQTTLTNGYLYEVGKATAPVDPEVKWGASADALTNSGTLAEAIAANAAYIQLQKDITSDSMLYFQNSVTIDLNGKALTAADRPHGVFGLYDLTITDSSEAKNGRLSATATDEGDSGVWIQGIITVKGGTLSGTGDDYGVQAGGSIIVTGGSLTGEGDTGVWASSEITVTGGSLSGTGTGENNGYGVFAGDPVIVENDGKITATGATAVYITNETDSSYTVESETTDAETGLTTTVLVAKAATSTYTVTVNSAENGTVTADKTEAAEGETVTLTVTPADGYVIDTLIVTDADGYVIHDDISYFTMPAYNVIVKVTFAPEPKITDIYVPEETPGYDPETKEFVITPENPLVFVWEGVSLHLIPDEWQILLAGLSHNDPVCGPAYAFTSDVTETKVTFNVNFSNCLAVLYYIDGSYIGKTVDYSQENAQLSDVKLYYSYVTVVQGENGTISVPYGMDPGETATITITPDEGYELDTLIVTDANGDPVTVENNTFTVPAGGATVTATFKVKYATIIDLNNAVKALEEKIAAQVDPDELAEAVTELEALIDAAKAYADTQDAALKSELEAAIVNAITASETAIKDWVDAQLEQPLKDIAALQAELSALAGSAATDAELAAAVAAQQAALDRAKSDLTAAYEKAIEDAINENNGKLNVEIAVAVKIAQDNLQAQIDSIVDEIEKVKARLDITEADINSINQQIDAINASINKLQNAINSGSTDLSAEITALNKALINAKAALEKADTENKAELVKKIEDADKALDEAIKAVQKNLEDAKNELQNAINANETDIEEKVTKLNQALESVKAALEATDAANKEALEKALANAESTLREAISGVQSDLDITKAKLDKAIEELNKAIADGDKQLSDEIDALEKALDNAKAALEKTDAANKEALEAAIATAKSVLQAAIDNVQTNLDNAKAELDNAIAKLETAMNNKDAFLTSEIAYLDTALNRAIAALEKADADNKAELIAKIQAAEATLNAAIKAVQKNLDDAKAELNKAIADGDTVLDGKILALNEALTTAKATLEAADTANKFELTTKIDESYASLDEAIKTVQKNLDDLKAALEAKDSELANKDAELENKDSELQTFIIIVCVISCAAFVGCVTLTVLYIIDKKKKTN